MRIRVCFVTQIEEDSLSLYNERYYIYEYNSKYCSFFMADFFVSVVIC